VKKTLAAVGASILGLAGALGASAAPASAATPLCTNALNDHVVNPDVAPATDAWYMTCVPQYGMGKAEYSITAPEGGFPVDYSLADGHQTVVSSTPTAAQVESYFGDFYHDDHRGTAPVYTGAFINLTLNADASTSTTQVYDAFDSNLPMTAAYPITSVAKLTTALPAACSPDGETYEGEYVVNYAPITTTFSELVGTKVYKTTVTLTAPTLYLGLNFDSSGYQGFDETKALCATSSAGTLFGPGTPLANASTPATAASPALHTADLPTGSDAWNTIANDAATNDSSDLTTLVPTTSSRSDLDPTPIVTGGPFSVTATSTLAETGVDATPAGILGGSLLIVGAGAFIFGRRRRRGAATRRD
jgi:LPXTG-motif cell wall-anchored protein